jgi:lambda family phage portal protein
LKSNVIGNRGFTLQVKALDTVGKLDQDGNDRVESAFRTWGKNGNCTVDGKMSWIDAQKLCIESLARDGEVFIVKHRANEFHDSFAIEFIEPDQVDEQKNERLTNGNEVRMGVELDKYKRPVAYHVLTYHPGDYDYTTMAKSPKHIRITADRMIHIFEKLRAGQTRGEPYLAPALASIKQLGALREASIVNARIGASKMGFFTSPHGDGFVPDDADGEMPIMEATPGTFHQLPNGVDFKAFDPQYPNNEFDVFHKSVLKGIASAMNVSYTSLSNDLEATSYSSIRQGALEERDHYRNLQRFLTDHFVRPIYEEWLSSAMEIDSFGIPVRQYDKFATMAQFRGKSWSWVDPQKEMNAAIMGLKNGVLSLQDVASNYGKDVEELMAQISRDKDVAAQFDIQYALEPYGATFNAVDAVVGDDDVE